MIDEIRLAEKSTWYVSNHPSNYFKGWNDCNRHWLDEIEKMPKLGEWIPCSERLPEEEGAYLLTAETISGIRYVRTGLLYSNGKFNGDRVIAWMPLPEPYKERSEE